MQKIINYESVCTTNGAVAFFSSFTCSAESTEGKGEGEDLAIASGKFETMHHPLALRMYYYCCSSGKRMPLTIRESEIFPKTFLGLLCFYLPWWA